MQIRDLCHNNDCALNDEGHPSCFKSWKHWEDAHMFCFIDEEGEPRNNEFWRNWRWNHTIGVWEKK